MKLYYIVLIIILSISININAQIVTSSCEADNSVIENYLEDAAYMTYQYTHQTNDDYVDSIQLSSDYNTTFLDALIAVYNANQLTVVDTLFNLYDIHTFPVYQLDQINLSVDSTTNWYHELRDGNIPTGYAPIDSLINLYSLSVLNIHNYSNILDFHTITFEATDYYNIDQLVEQFLNLDGVVFSETVNTFGDGNTIEASFIDNNVSLVFSYGWGDCQAGCINRQFWEFIIYPNCSVEYKGTSGDIISSLSNIETEYSIFPNPFINEIRTSETLNGFDFSISNLNGQIIREGKINNMTIRELNNLPKQSYILKLFKGDKNITKLLIKN